MFQPGPGHQAPPYPWTQIQSAVMFSLVNRNAKIFTYNSEYESLDFKMFHLRLQHGVNRDCPSGHRVNRLAPQGSSRSRESLPPHQSIDLEPTCSSAYSSHYNITRDMTTTYNVWDGRHGMEWSIGMGEWKIGWDKAW